MNLHQSLMCASTISQPAIDAAAGKCKCRGACGTHTGPCNRKSQVQGMCTTCNKLAAAGTSPDEGAGDGKVWAPSDLADRKGILPVGDWIGEEMTTTTVATPSALGKSSGSVHDDNGKLGTQMPSDVIKSKAKTIVPGSSLAASRTIAAGGPGSGRRPGWRSGSLNKAALNEGHKQMLSHGAQWSGSVSNLTDGITTHSYSKNGKTVGRLYENPNGQHASEVRLSGLGGAHNNAGEPSEQPSSRHPVKPGKLTRVKF